MWLSVLDISQTRELVQLLSMLQTTEDEIQMTSVEKML